MTVHHLLKSFIVLPVQDMYFTSLEDYQQIEKVLRMIIPEVGGFRMADVDYLQKSPRFHMS